MHSFEMSGMGKPPFRYHIPERPDLLAVPACEHCGRTISNINHVISSDGVVSMVGTDCLKKSGDEGLIAGHKRHLREIRAQQREDDRMKRIAKKESRERQDNNGKTLAEIAQDKAEYHETEAQRIHAQMLEFVDNNPLLAHCNKTQGFCKAMVLNALTNSPLSKGMSSALVKVEAKRLSGARANSKAFNAVLEQARKNVNDIADKIQNNHDYLHELKY